MTDNLPVAKPSYSLRPTSLDDAAKIARAMASSGMFGFKSPEQALSIMLLADAEGLHPAAAARDYHVIEGRPTLKADAMLARFQAAGGKVEWHERTDKIVRATFTHEAGGSLEVTWTIERANSVVNKYGTPITDKLVWKNYPAQMLTARCISEGVRTVYPGVMNGFYAPEEFDAIPGMAPEEQAPQIQQQQTEPDDPAPPREDPVEKWLQQIGMLANEASIDAWAKRHASKIAQLPKVRREKVQAAIRSARERVKEAAHLPDVQDAEFTEQGPFSDSGDVPPDPETEGPFSDDDLPPPGTSYERKPEAEEPQEGVAPDSAVQRFRAAMLDKIKQAPSEMKLDGMWDAHAQKLARVKKGDKKVWTELYEAKRDRAAILREFEQEAELDG